MNSAEGELEAAIWVALKRHAVTVDHAGDLVTDLMAAATAYAAADSEALTAARRMVLHEATAPSPRQTPPSSATGSRRPTPPELNPPGSGGRLLEGATLSTDRVIPSQVSRGLPQAVDNRPVDKG